MHEEFTDSDRNSIRFVGSKIYSVQTCNIYYTSYDLQRQCDTVNPRTHPDIMLRSPVNEEGAEPYWYACHVPYFLGLSPSFSGLPATFPPVPDPFPCVFSYSHPFRSLPLSSDLPRHPSLPRFPSISVYIFVPTRFLSIFHIRIRP